MTFDNMNPPATKEEIQDTEKELGFKFPEEIVKLYLKFNGGCGFIGEMYVTFYTLKELKELNDIYSEIDEVQGYFVIGSDGGGESFGFLKDQVPTDFLMVPFIPMNLENAKVIGKTFDEFIDYLMKGI